MDIDIEWIDLSNAPLGTDETRTKVRSHAMKATAASRKKTATWGKRNLRQLPGYRITNDAPPGISSSMPNDETSTDTVGALGQTRGAFAPSKPTEWSPMAVNISPAMPLAGIELLAAEFGVHILDLSALTSIQCGWTACAILASRPSWINGLVSRRQPSYLHCVASRYGSNSCLDEALRCVAIRAKRVLSPSCLPFDLSESLQYGAALKSLQKAVDDVEERSQPEVLGAINLLSLFELLQYTREQAWALHTTGASRLIRARGAASFVSDFDIELMLSMTTAITHECMRSHEPCFFEEDPWQQMFQSFVIKSNLISSRSPLAISLMCIMVRGPRIMRDVCIAVIRPEGSNCPDLARLRKQLREYRGELLQWHAEYVLATLVTPSHEGTQTPSGDIRSELLATCYGLLISCSRMLSAITVDLLDFLEDEAVAYATQMMKLESDISSTNKWASFYIAQKLVVARATLATTILWRECSDRCTGIIAPNKFRAWLSAILMQ
ncbi:hypothetical protein HD806DRAFT_492649 [Xylariaceae sp. AK1471]|nr:hypothetical protein HD806DRAFT_492649 [Xylariaceae sp. AK1471]